MDGIPKKAYLELMDKVEAQLNELGEAYWKLSRLVRCMRDKPHTVDEKNIRLAFDYTVGLADGAPNLFGVLAELGQGWPIPVIDEAELPTAGRPNPPQENRATPITNTLSALRNMNEENNVPAQTDEMVEETQPGPNMRPNFIKDFMSSGPKI